MKANGSGLSEKAIKALEIMAGIRAKEVALADKYLPIIKERTPTGKSAWGELVVGTGETRRSWAIHIKRNDAKEVIWEISPDGKEDIMTFLEFGTKAHIILPKSPTGVLVFEWGPEGTMFLKHVHHPGTKPLGIVRITQAEIDEEGRKLVEELHTKLRTINV